MEILDQMTVVHFLTALSNTDFNVIQACQMYVDHNVEMD